MTHHQPSREQAILNYLERELPREVAIVRRRHRRRWACTVFGIFLICGLAHCSLATHPTAIEMHTAWHEGRSADYLGSALAEDPLGDPERVTAALRIVGTAAPETTARPWIIRALYHPDRLVRENAAKWYVLRTPRDQVPADLAPLLDSLQPR